MKTYKKLDLLIAIYIFCIVAAELMGVKTFPLVNVSWLNLNASVAILLFPVIFSINDIITETYGKERARSVIYAGIFVVFLTFVFAAIATMLPASTRFSETEWAYDKIFISSLRISAASLAAFILAQVTDLLVFVKIKQKLGRKSLWLRTNASNFVAQLLDTSVFICLAFYSFHDSFSNNINFLLSLIIPYWLLKCFMSVIETPVVYAGVKWLKDEK